jgi:hypothetical protein
MSALHPRTLRAVTKARKLFWHFPTALGKGYQKKDPLSALIPTIELPLPTLKASKANLDTEVRQGRRHAGRLHKLFR